MSFSNSSGIRRCCGFFFKHFRGCFHGFGRSTTFRDPGPRQRRTVKCGARQLRWGIFLTGLLLWWFAPPTGPHDLITPFHFYCHAKIWILGWDAASASGTTWAYTSSTINAAEALIASHELEVLMHFFLAFSPDAGCRIKSEPSFFKSIILRTWIVSLVVPKAVIACGSFPTRTHSATTPTLGWPVAKILEDISSSSQPPLSSSFIGSVTASAVHPLLAAYPLMADFPKKTSFSKPDWFRLPAMQLIICFILRLKQVLTEAAQYALAMASSKSLMMPVITRLL